MYKVLMCGDRNWDDYEVIAVEVERLRDEHGRDMLVIEGKAPGADIMSGIAARDLDVHVAEVGALWETRRRGAGPQRNQVMLDLGPDEVIAFHSNIKESRGTKDMLKRAEKAGVPTRVVTS